MYSVVCVRVFVIYIDIYTFMYMYTQRLQALNPVLLSELRESEPPNE